MEKLTTGRTSAPLSPALDDPTDWRPVFDWMSVINLGGIVYVGLDALSDCEVAGADIERNLHDYQLFLRELLAHDSGVGTLTTGWRAPFAERQATL